MSARKRRVWARKRVDDSEYPTVTQWHVGFRTRRLVLDLSLGAARLSSTAPITAAKCEGMR